MKRLLPVLTSFVVLSLSTTEGWSADPQKDRQKAIGLAVPGMPIGSPRMEQGNRRN